MKVSLIEECLLQLFYDHCVREEPGFMIKALYSNRKLTGLGITLCVVFSGLCLILGAGLTYGLALSIDGILIEYSYPRTRELIVETLWDLTPYIIVLFGLGFSLAFSAVYWGRTRKG